MQRAAAASHDLHIGLGPLEDIGGTCLPGDLDERRGLFGRSSSVAAGVQILEVPDERAAGPDLDIAAMVVGDVVERSVVAGDRLGPVPVERKQQASFLEQEPREASSEGSMTSIVRPFA